LTVAPCRGALAAFLRRLALVGCGFLAAAFFLVALAERAAALRAVPFVADFAAARREVAAPDFGNSFAGYTNIIFN
jgi:hypothetical protein